MITLNTAEGSSYNPAIMATCPGRDSVGTLVLDSPHLPLLEAIDLRFTRSISFCHLIMLKSETNRKKKILIYLRKGALGSRSFPWLRNVSNLKPSAEKSTSLLAGAGMGFEIGVIPLTIGDWKWISNTETRKRTWTQKALTINHIFLTWSFQTDGDWKLIIIYNSWLLCPVWQFRRPVVVMTTQADDAWFPTLKKAAQHQPSASFINPSFFFWKSTHH